MSDIPVEDIAHRLKKAIKKLTTHQVATLIEVIDAIVTETKKESRAQAIDECVKTLQEMPAIVLRYEGEIVTECMRPSWSDCIEKLKAMIKEQP
jgi:hypothetical protein